MSRYGPPGEPHRPYRRSHPGPEEYGPPSDPWGGEGRGGEGRHPDQRHPDYYDPPPGYEPEYGPPGYGPQGYESARYGQPGYDPPGYGQPAYDAPGYGQPGYEPPPPAYDRPPGDDWADPPDDGWDAIPPPPPRRPIGLYALVAVLVVLAASGVGYALYLLTGEDGEPTAAPPTAPAATGTPQATPTAGAERDNIGLNAATAQVDDCLVNDGSAEQPQMRVVACDAEDEDRQLFEVLEIFDERVEGEGDIANEQAQSVCADTEGYTHHYYEVGETESFVLCMAELDPDD